MCFLILFGGFIQIVTFLVLIRSNDLKSKSLTPYLINVVAANMVMIVGSFPSTLASAIANQWAFNEVVCRVVGFLGGIAAISMIATMTCITAKRSQLEGVQSHINGLVVLNSWHAASFSRLDKNDQGSCRYELRTKLEGGRHTRPCICLTFSYFSVPYTRFNSKHLPLEDQQSN